MFPVVRSSSSESAQLPASGYSDISSDFQMLQLFVVKSFVESSVVSDSMARGLAWRCKKLSRIS